MTAPTQTPDAISYLFTFQCPDRLGILAKVSTLLFQEGAYVTESLHYGDPKTEQFFARMVFDDHVMKDGIGALNQKMSSLASELDMKFEIRPAAYRPKALIAVSKYDHCLNLLLTKWRAGALHIDIVGVVSNHNDCRSLVEWYGIAFHHLPITPDTKPQQETQILDLFATTGAELLVLARYMQILSDDLSRKLEGRAMNIHHSFLPGFKGARPYHQAYDRGVKVIGATAHFVTSDLDEGPIIAQEVKTIDHAHTAEDMVLVGHDTEAVALANAVRLFSEGRIFLNGHRTVIL
ncbi:formyltetrahydrofolate deformylase [Burkholderia gladioli]|uniref:Formyltetrahydrofolate deformylase n=1 Tax=Burkholderia gladioli TaxID=28095 RepID=A0A095F2Y3_BURGA|nr:formyltetrahydrofolate deformylase [Burkholderia gladioli]AJW99188.1 formyltetrahydrofolate deformylase [Burkholderia gladioli]ASD79905.1 formyltetrahydrofolate deformylase [Burkholderia gladioli pv. gladioli]AWY54853.1 formyltetrahydrofolate deformylase [Burkholderia gladioli pv. gladioli]KGC11703.1 formyltetrahydrofolate deformylase [Burkholderia gladioli]PEH37866.1 formyltetrahydrofolate deformylase [Burkholderia gladioli]